MAWISKCVRSSVRLWTQTTGQRSHVGHLTQSQLMYARNTEKSSEEKTMPTFAADLALGTGHISPLISATRMRPWNHSITMTDANNIRSLAHGLRQRRVI